MGWSEEEQRYTPQLIPQKTMTEPFAESDSWLCRRSGYYAVHGVDQIAASPLRYCAVEQFFELDGDDPWENTMGLLAYLGLWTRYPRVEQLAKAGCEKIINDAIQGSMNSRALNWRAKTMPAFFGVDKPAVKRLLAGGIGQKELEALEQAGRLVVISPSVDLQVTRLEGDMEKLGRLYWMGNQDANAQLERLRAYLV